MKEKDITTWMSYSILVKMKSNLHVLLNIWRRKKFRFLQLMNKRKGLVFFFIWGTLFAQDQFHKSNIHSLNHIWIILEYHLLNKYILDNLNNTCIYSFYHYNIQAARFQHGVTTYFTHIYKYTATGTILINTIKVYLIGFLEH